MVTASRTHYRLNQPDPDPGQGAVPEPAPDTDPPHTSSRGSALGAAFGDAARTIGKAAAHDLPQVLEQRRHRDRPDRST